MSEVVFVNAYEFDYLGTRVLAAWLRKNGITTHNILLDDNLSVSTDLPSEQFIGYQYANPVINEHRAMHTPLNEGDWQALEEAIKLENPQIIGFSARSTNNFLIEPLINVFKKAAPAALLVCGGFGPTLEPDLYLQGGFDVVARGDGEESLLALAKAWQTKDWQALKKIPNTIWSPEHGGHVNRVANQIRDISIYPPPLRGNAYFSWISCGKLHRSNDPMLSSPTYRTFLGRGCPGKCAYCSGGQWKTLYQIDGAKAYVRRNRNIDEVIHELESLPEHVEKVWFCDEFWCMPKAETRRFFEQYRDKVHKPFWAYLNYSQMNEDHALFDLVIDAGLYSTGIGIQTGSARLLQSCYQRKPKYDELLKYAHYLHENYVAVSFQLIGGNCYETEADFQETLDFIRRLPFSLEHPQAAYITYFRLRPHPESPIRKTHPRVVSDPMPVWLWQYHALLSQYAQYLEKNDFDAIVQSFEQPTQENASQLLKALKARFETAFAKKVLSHYTDLIKQEQSKKWVFYGAGDTYRINKEFFTPLAPIAMIVDSPYKAKAAAQTTLPVMDLEELASSYDLADLNYMAFMPDPLAVMRKLQRAYNIPANNLHSSAAFMPDLIKKANCDV